MAIIGNMHGNNFIIIKYNLFMSYYYQSHLRNLEEQALLQKRKIASQLHEKDLLKESDRSLNSPHSHKKSRRIETQQMAAYLERSRMEAQLSAMRSKAEGSMNRSRLESAFELRKQNQKAMEEIQRMDRRHFVLLERSNRHEQEVNMSALISLKQAEQAARQEVLVRDLSLRQNMRINDEVNSARRLTKMLNDRYQYPY